ncbi:hypothetical protein K8Q96_01420 [Candidatus Nomurabacteria bacterium]|jgi:uncharacterized membrane protein YuzA (DUF378 family)|nr:hypothetical protein [Candidatus Nomurabacteria bacterium]
MRKERTLFILGLWVAVLPFLGFPNMWRKIFFVITGLALVFLAYLFYSQTKKRILKDDRESKAFVDNI